MPVLKPLPLWIVVSVFVMSAAAIPLTWRLLRASAEPPQTLTKLTELLSHEAPSLYVVPVVENQPEGGIYICTQPWPRERLSYLARNLEAIDRWKGVVFCEGASEFFIIEDHEIQTWGEHGKQIGPLLYFGDPDLLQRIEEAIFNQQRGQKLSLN